VPGSCALASLGVFDEQQPLTFDLTGRMLQGKPGVYDMGLWIPSLHFRAYAEMLHAVTTGTPAAETVTMPVSSISQGREQRAF
jgi:hypothetical protein